jgi:hypothetical protein
MLFPQHAPAQRHLLAARPPRVAQARAPRPRALRVTHARGATREAGPRQRRRRTAPGDEEGASGGSVGSLSDYEPSSKEASADAAGASARASSGEEGSGGGRAYAGRPARALLVGAGCLCSVPSILQPVTLVS